MQEELYLEVSGVEHVLDDHHSLVSLTQFCFLLRPPVQLPANTSRQNQITGEERGSSSHRNERNHMQNEERKKMVLLLLLQFFAILFALLFLLAGIILAFQLKTSRFNMQPVTSDLILIQQTLSQRYRLSLNTHTH